MTKKSHGYGVAPIEGLPAPRVVVKRVNKKGTVTAVSVPEPACQIVLTSAAPDAPWEWNVKGYALFDAIALTSLMLDQMRALAFQRMSEKAKEMKDG